jgi:N-formylglutamate amidohydrolase
LALFTARLGEAVVVRAPVSRLVVDIERFPDDEDEPMAARGMGAIYRVTSSLAPLRRPLSPEERATLMRTWYAPHHSRLERAVAEALQRHGRCLVIDCHSFPSNALPYEQADPAVARPDICIGTDAFHTGDDIATAFTEAFRHSGWTVAVDQPFAGALVPASRYRRDPRVGAVMIEVNRRLYLDERDATKRPDFDAVAARVGACCVAAAEGPSCVTERIDRGLP